MFQPMGNQVIKVATIKCKNMLPVGIFFPLKVAPMRIDNNIDLRALN